MVLSNKVIDTIPVGRNPVGIAVNPTTNKIYATNLLSLTISVINASTNKVSSTITEKPLSGSYRVHDPVSSLPLVARFPLIASLVAVNDVSNMIYVTNTGSDTVSIVDGKVDGIVERLNFNITPPNSGDIQCNGQPIMQSVFAFYRNGTHLQCYADAGQGYEFNSWSNIAFGSSNPLDLRVSQYGGTLTANYKPTLTFEQYLAVILGPISVVSIIVGWFFRNRQTRHLNKYMAIIETAYEALSDNNNTKDCLLHLQLVRKEITNLFVKGKISDGYYNILDRKSSEYIERVKTDKM
jgi:YVTN family beta-propeller protein